MRLQLPLAAIAALVLAGCEVRDPGNKGDEGGGATAEAEEEAPEAPAPTAPEPAPLKAALGEGNSDNGDFRLAVTDATRSNGVLTIKARVTLVNGQTGERRLLYSSEAADPYLVSGDQKYMMLKDNDGQPLTVQGGYYPRFSRLGDTNNWWGKFPAPPPEVKAISLYFRGFEPVENVPITER